MFADLMNFDNLRRSKDDARLLWTNTKHISIVGWGGGEGGYVHIL